MAQDSRTFGTQLKTLREGAGFTQEELATIAGLSVHAVSALERGQRRRPQVETVRALAAALDLAPHVKDALTASARPASADAAVDELTSSALPVSPTRLIGREADLDALRPWFADASVRLITLTGPGGVGKTRLALELAREVAAEHRVRVAFAALAAIRDPGLAACAMAEAFGLAELTAADLPKRVRAACEGHPTLLVLDNFEQVLDAAPTVAALLAATASLRVLVTSRAPLRLRGERDYQVGPLAIDPVGAGDEDALTPAVRLFLERIRDAQPEFRVTDANAPVITAICRRLDALPLALELAAPWIKVLSPEDLLRRLEAGALAPAIGPRDLPERQQTMDATVAWSYQLLSAEAQCAFRRLSVLPGRFSIDAVTAVTSVSCGATAAVPPNATPRVLAELIEKSLLVRQDTAVATRAMYGMFETVRAFASREAQASGEQEIARGALARYCLTESARVADGLLGLSQLEWLDRAHEDLENYRGALTWLIDRGRAEEAAEIVWGLFFFWVIRGYTAEGLWWCDTALKHPLPTLAKARTLIGAAAMRFTQGDLDRAQVSLDEAVLLAAGDSMTIARAQMLLGHVELSRGHLDESRRHFSHGLAAFEDARAPWGVGHMLSALAWVALASGDAEEAEDFIARAVAPLESAGPWFLELTLNIRSLLAVKRGHSRDAIVAVREGLERSRQLQDKFAFVYALVALGAAAGLTGDSEWVARIAGARDAVTERTGAMAVDPFGQAMCERAQRDARARLGGDRWAAAYAAGQTLSIDDLLEELDRVLM